MFLKQNLLNFYGLFTLELVMLGGEGGGGVVGGGGGEISLSQDILVDKLIIYLVWKVNHSHGTRDNSV